MCSNYLDIKQAPQDKVVKHFFFTVTWHSGLRCWGGLVMEGLWNAQKSPKMFLYVPKWIPNPWPQSEPNSSAPAWLRAVQGRGWRIPWCHHIGAEVFPLVQRSSPSQALPAGPRWQGQFPLWAQMSCTEISIISLTKPCCSAVLQRGHSRAALFSEVGHTPHWAVIRALGRLKNVRLL